MLGAETFGTHHHANGIINLYIYDWSYSVIIYVANSASKY
jgi:hypothetical protein